MTRATTWTNADGLVVGFGKNYAERQDGAVRSVGGHSHQAVLDFTYQSTAAAAGDCSVVIPAGAVVNSVVLKTGTLWNGGTALEIGDAADPNGWFTTTLLAEATLDNADNQVFVADGAYAVGGTADDKANGKAYLSAGQIDVLITGTFTSGTARLIVDYTL